MISLKNTLEAIKSKIDNYGTRLNTLEQHEVYSTSEKRIGTWIDGKPLYRKVITGTSTSGQWSKNVSSLNIDYPVSIRLSMKNTTGGDYCFGSYWNASNDALNFYMTSNKQVIWLRSASGYAYGKFNLIIEYTKTTD